MIWVIMVAIGLITYMIRLSFIVVLGNMAVPRTIRRALRLVPAAVLPAIFLPEMLLPGGHLDLSFTNARMIAGVVAIVVAAWSRNILVTIGVGMAVLLLWQTLIH